jgi:hypothetical protein
MRNTIHRLDQQRTRSTSRLSWPEMKTASVVSESSRSRGTPGERDGDRLDDSPCASRDLPRHVDPVGVRVWRSFGRGSPARPPHAGREAVPLASLASITVACIVLAQDWRKVHVRSAGWLVISTFLGIPVGLWLLTAAPEAGVKAILAIVIIGFSSYCLISRSPYHLKDDRLALAFGFGASVLGALTG